ERLSHEAQAADQPTLAAAVLKAQDAFSKARDPIDVASARGELSEALVDFVATSTEPMGFAPVSAPVPLAPMKPITLVEDFEHDDEMREVFLEEAREVVESARAACAELQSTPGDLELLTTLRRAFHTLKGSARMVGLKAFGEAAWSCEQVFNTQLAEQRAAEPPLIEFSGWALAYLGEWVEDIAAHRSGSRNEREVQAAASRLAGGSGAQASDIALPIGLPRDLPSRSDLDLRRPEIAEAQPEIEDLSFELDLSNFDRPVEPGSGSPGPAVTVPTPADASAMFDRFDDARSEAMQTTLANEQFDFASSGMVDLDLGSPAERPGLIQNLAPSEGASGDDSVSGLSLDLASGEAISGAEPADFAQSGIVDLEVGGDAVAGEAASDEHVKIVGPLRIGIPLFNIYLNEADELSRRLMTEVAEWAMELHRPVGEVPIALAHSLAGSSATVGFTDLSQLARSLEHALARTQVIGYGTEEEARLFVNAAEDIRRLLHQFAAGFLHQPSPELLVRLSQHELSSALRLEAATAASELAEGQESESPIEPAIAALPLLSLDGMEDASIAANDSFVDAAPGEQGSDGATAAGAREDIDVGAADAPSSAADAARAAPEPVAPVAIKASAPVVAPSHADAADDAFAGPETSERAEPAASVFGGLGGFHTLGVSELKPLAAAPLDAGRAAPARASTFGEVDDDIDAVDAVDLELFPIFEEEAQELLPKLDSQLRDWLREPATAAHAGACMRTLHTLKGGARLAGAMRLGEMAHRLETRIERLTATDAAEPKAEDVEALQAVSDAMTNAFEALRSRDAQAYSDAVAAATAPVATSARPSEPARTPIAEAPVFVATPIVPAAADATPVTADDAKRANDKG
ncbi:MAG: Hpt domain-containing protein, partial [Pseudomonadota bacterium]|nr:Hpt domain-containing protein [Pseudomonadota bacterium]